MYTKGDIGETRSRAKAAGSLVLREPAAFDTLFTSLVHKTQNFAENNVVRGSLQASLKLLQYEAYKQI